ncbi:MAG: hypothetical protein WBY88_05560, partial [Desulfosarcina sp.]
MRRYTRSGVGTMMTALILLILVGWASEGRCTREIVLGAATSLTFLEGRESLNAVELAVAEINAGGGVRVDDTRLPLRVVPLDLGGARPEMPVSEALQRLERMIIDHRIQAMVVGPF